jgi:hypothetical protein
VVDLLEPPWGVHAEAQLESAVEVRVTVLLLRGRVEVSALHELRQVIGLGLLVKGQQKSDQRAVAIGNYA